MKAAMGAADPTRKAAMTTDHDDDFEPHHSSSPTDQALHELQLYGYRPFQDEPDPRPLPEAHRLEPDLEDLLWLTVNVFHRAIDRIELELDDNELAQQRSQREQDGSEVKSVELERRWRTPITLSTAFPALSSRLRRESKLGLASHRS
jgi:hypothetical protein